MLKYLYPESWLAFGQLFFSPLGPFKAVRQLRSTSAVASTAFYVVHLEGGDRRPDFLAAARNEELVPHCSNSSVQHHMREVAKIAVSRPIITYESRFAAAADL